MTTADFRRVALSLSGAEESSHMGAADFRVGSRIFATLAHEKLGYGNLMITPAQQQEFCAERPDLFLPVAGGWGRMGATHIRLAEADTDTMMGALTTAWKHRIQLNDAAAKKRSLAASEPGGAMTRLLFWVVAFLPALALTQDAHQRKTRDLFVFAPSTADASFRQQIAWIKESRVALLDRDVAVVLIFDQNSEADLSGYVTDDLFLLLNSRDEDERRRFFHLRHGQFAVILVGKDGGEKLRRQAPLSMEALSKTIDAMPMRKDEMRSRNQR